ncbi:ATP-binding protein [Streptomyces sp. NBC_01089]|uniref:ATP-binding protein n=1 Tax=Streptomyces sp. NBC_01089 TaxID=2903747 RepID=UPI00386D72C3|nr:tetratricopeptide repeat protein [Streptomyces sp. NBC_01089]
MNQSSNDLSGTVTGTVVQAGHVGELHLASPVPTALAGLPPAAPEFTGRETALRTVADALRSGADGGTPVVVPTLVGTAGVGKTALALRAAHDALAAGWFPGGVLFINFQGYDEDRRLRTDVALSVVLSALGVPDEHFPPTLQGRLSLYHSKLADLAAQRRAVLVMLDNAASTDRIGALLPGPACHRALVTSRHTLGDLPGSRIVDLGVLDPPEAGALIARTLRMRRPDDTRTEDEPGAVRDLAGLCGHLPLAVAVVASILAGDPDQSVGELTAALRDRATRLAELSYGSGRSVTAAFDLSYATLGPDEARTFRLLSLNLGQQVSAEAAAALTGLPAPRVRKLLGALRAAHMVEPGRPRGWFRLHDLLRLYAEGLRREQDDEEATGAAIDRLLAHYRDSARDATGRIVEAARHGLRDDASERWLDTERTNLRTALYLARTHGRYTAGLPLAHDVSWFLRRQQDWAAGLEACDMAVSFARRGTDSGQEALALYNKGDFLKHKQDYALALHTFAEALDMYRRIGDRAGEALTLHSMGTAARRRGRYAEAETHYRAALPLFRAGEDEQAVAHTLYNLATTARHQGDHDAAHDHYHRALATYRALGHPVGEARTLHHLGLLALAADRPDTAREHWERARTAYEEAGLPQPAGEVTELLDRLTGPGAG